MSGLDAPITGFPNGASDLIRCRLSACDAFYLELSLRTSLPLATLDEDLRKTARKAGVRRFAMT